MDHPRYTANANQNPYPLYVHLECPYGVVKEQCRPCPSDSLLECLNCREIGGGLAIAKAVSSPVTFTHHTRQTIVMDCEHDPILDLVASYILACLAGRGRQLGRLG